MSSERSVGRGVTMILIVGTALGLTHNWSGLRGRPPHGIPWVGADPATVSLESLMPQDSATTSSEEPGPAAALSGPASGAIASTRTPATSRPGPSTPVTPAASLPLIPDAEQPIDIKLPVAKAFFEADAALFIDARDPEEYEAGHIARAMRMTHNDALLEPEGLKSLPVRGRPIIAYCSGGTCEASHDLANDLIDAGYRKVLVYTGGFPEWASAGLPIEKGGR